MKDDRRVIFLEAKERMLGFEDWSFELKELEDQSLVVTSMTSDDTMRETSCKRKIHPKISR
jgi:hypothetical protein